MFAAMCRFHLRAYFGSGLDGPLAGVVRPGQTPIEGVLLLVAPRSL
jgi:hypothetical protein